MGTSASNNMKISVKIYKPILEKLDDKMKSACLRRDEYLKRVLGNELDHLNQEVSISNSQASYDYITRSLDQLDRKLVSLTLTQELTDKLNDVCKSKRIVRDAFFNRLFLLLVASPIDIDKLLFRFFEGDWKKRVLEGWKHDSAFIQDCFYPLESVIDPFWAIRDGLAFYKDQIELEDYVIPENGMTIKVERDFIGCMSPAPSLYTITFGKDGNTLTGFNCYLPDHYIPGSQSEKNYKNKLDEILIGLE